MNYTEKTAQLRALEKGWDGYDAEPPHDPAIALAVLIAMGVEKAQRAPDRFEASVAGGVGLTYYGDGAEVYVETYNRGGALMLVSEDAEDAGEITDMRNKAGFECVPIVAEAVAELQDPLTRETRARREAERGRP